MLVKATVIGMSLFCTGLVFIGLAACTAGFGVPQSSGAASTSSITSMSDNTPNPTATIDGTATAAAMVIAEALSATPGMMPTLIPAVDQIIQVPPTVDPAATQTGEAQRIATVVAATLTAQPTITPTPTPTWPPTATPDLDATQTAAAQQIATAVMATIMAQPKATPTTTWTPTPAARIANFATCLEPCRGDRTNVRHTFPERTTKVYLTWVFGDFPVGAHYTRSWTLVGKGEWTRYECTWPGPEAGTENIALSAPRGIHSGVWEVTITLDQVVVLREQLTIEGNWALWDPPGLFTTCYGTR